MNKRIILALALGVSLGVQAQDVSEITNAYSIYGNNMSVGTARYMGMAGAMGALGGDVSSIDINPAAVGVYITGDFQGTLGITNYHNTSRLGNAALKYKNDDTDLAQAGGVISVPLGGPSWKFLNIGLNYSYKNLDNRIETPGNHNIAEDFVDQNGQVLETSMYDGHAYDRTGHLIKTNLSVGANYNNQVYIGAGLNFHSADFDQFDTYRVMYGSDNATTLYDKQYTPYSESATGFSASIGVIARAAEILRLGASLETPTWWKADRAFTQYFTNDPDNGDFTISQINTYSETRNFRSPAKGTLSAAVVPTKNFALDVDYTVGFGTPHFTTSTAANDQLNAYFEDASRNMSEFRVGAEYRLLGFRARAGYAIANNPYESGSLQIVDTNNNVSNATFSDLYIGKKNTLGLGIGYDFKGFYIDAAYQNLKYDYNNPFFGGEYATNSSVNSEGVFNDVSIVPKVKNEQNNFFLTLGYKF